MISTANGFTLLEATVTLPRTGVWHADLVVDTGTVSNVTGAVSLSLVDGQLVLAGTSYRPPLLWRGVTHVRIAAGKAGMGTLLSPQGYTHAPAKVIVTDILSGAGESLSSTSVSLSQRTTWARLEETAGTALQAIADELDLTWRSLPDGTVWVGTETWPASPLTDFQVLEAAPEDSRLQIVASGPTLLPGQTLKAAALGGPNVGRVVYQVRDDNIRAEVFFES